MTNSAKKIVWPSFGRKLRRMRHSRDFGRTIPSAALPGRVAHPWVTLSRVDVRPSSADVAVEGDPRPRVLHLLAAVAVVGLVSVLAEMFRALAPQLLRAARQWSLQKQMVIRAAATVITAATAEPVVVGIILSHRRDLAL